MTPNIRQLIRFTHEEIEALLALYPLDGEEPLTNAEKSAKEKLKQIYARQILSHEKRQYDLGMENKLS